MTPDDMARMHRAAFSTERPWHAKEFSDLLENRHVRLITDAHGFALTRTVAGESELLTLAVDPAHQRKGIGRRITQNWLLALEGTADEAFLEVAADNRAARALYSALGFAEIARRPAYYLRKNNDPADAIVMRLTLTQRSDAFSAR